MGPDARVGDARLLPTIGIVIPLLNQGRDLGQALTSIFQAEYPAVEVVVMDGGSTDESLSVIRAHEARLKYWRSRPDDGPVAAVNEGMARCTGDLVAWLNATDRYLGDGLWTVARAYVERPGFGLYIGNGLRRGPDGQETPFRRRHLALNRRALAAGLDHVFQPATFILRSAWEEAKGLRPDLRLCADWDLVVRIASRHPTVLVNDFLAARQEAEVGEARRHRLRRAAEIRAHSVEEHLHQEPVDTDGFPATGDAQDAVHLPFAGRHPRRPAAAWTRPLPSISVVVPSLNQSAFLGQALDSLTGQAYLRLETLVCDGGSTDGSVDVLRRYGAALAYWVSEPDRGPAHAINKGLARASGDVLGWLSSDDMLAEGTLAAVGRAFADDPALDLVYANALYIDEENRLHPADHGDYRTGLYYGEMQPVSRIPAYWTYVHAVPQPTVFFRRRLLDACGSLDDSYHYIFDFELFHRFAARARTKKLERTLAFYRLHAAGRTREWQRFLVELYRFSRPRWPPVFSPGFLATWRSFVGHHVACRSGRRPGDPRAWPLTTRVALMALTALGNPEALDWPRPFSRGAPGRSATAAVTPRFRSCRSGEPARARSRAETGCDVGP